MTATRAGASRCTECTECGWTSQESSEAVVQFLAVAHVAHRHPSVYEAVIGRPSSEFVVGLSEAEKRAYDIAVGTGML